VSNWQPIETVPHGVECLFWQPGRELFPGYSLGPYMMVGTFDGAFHPSNISGYEWECEMEKPTHWRPLPRPPAGDS
jgi:hypothetical protein